MSDPDGRAGHGPLIERALTTAVSAGLGAGFGVLAEVAAPERLSRAIEAAVFPGGGRIRPRLLLAVAEACAPGLRVSPVAVSAACAIELVHCASLAQDDLPVFDDAAQRRGRPSLHARFGAPLALLAGDALIVRAFGVLAAGCAAVPALCGPLVALLARASGTPCGIAAGQAWEVEPVCDQVAYRRAKTGALFAGAAGLGAVASGAEEEGWSAFGLHLGEAYQIRDDLIDAGLGIACGKPIGVDRVLGRPNASLSLGPDAALARLQALVEEAIAIMPACAGADRLRAQVRAALARSLPKGGFAIAA